jgi:hypothetical protein
MLDHALIQLAVQARLQTLAVVPLLSKFTTHAGRKAS